MDSRSRNRVPFLSVAISFRAYGGVSPSADNTRGLSAVCGTNLNGAFLESHARIGPQPADNPLVLSLEKRLMTCLESERQ